MSHFLAKKELILNHFKFRTLLRCEDNLKHSPEVSNYFSRYFEKSKRIAGEPLNLAVMGEFSVGKSSLINRLLGVDFLPVGITPITSVVTTMKYGENEKNKVKIRYSADNGEEETFGYESYSILADYQKASEIDNEVYWRKAKSIKEIVVYLDNDNLKKFNIIDTPGFNHSEKCDTITRELFDQLDFVVWMFDAAQVGKLTESVLLNELFAKVKNIYAIINKSDIVDPVNLDQVVSEWNEKISGAYQGKFINKEIPCISLKNFRGEFAHRYQRFNDDFNVSIINEDYSISSQEIESLYDEMHLHLVQMRPELEALQADLDALFTDFINYSRSADFKKYVDELSEEIFTIVVKLIRDVVVEITASDIQKKLPSQNPTIKFYCLYRTFEKIEQLKETVGKVYKDYWEFYEKKFEQFEKSVDEFVAKFTSLYPDDLKKGMKEDIDYCKSVIIGFKAKKHILATTGYMFGLLSDNFIYEKFVRESSRKMDDVITKKAKTLWGTFSEVEKNNKVTVKTDMSDKNALLKVAGELNREIIVRLFKLDLETAEIENTLRELIDKINFSTKNISTQLLDISEEMRVAKC